RGMHLDAAANGGGGDMEYAGAGGDGGAVSQRLPCAVGFEAEGRAAPVRAAAVGQLHAAFEDVPEAVGRSAGGEQGGIGAEGEMTDVVDQGFVVQEERALEAVDLHEFGHEFDGRGVRTRAEAAGEEDFEGGTSEL